MERLEATIEGTVFRNPENGYSVLTVRSGRSEVTVIGTLPELSPGEQAVFTGEWTEHRTYGRQFRCSSCELKVPTTLLGIERFLGSGLIHGVGPSTATLIVSAFGEETLTVLSEHPERLSEVKGIGAKRAAMIAESFREQQGARRAMSFSSPTAFLPPWRYASATTTATAPRKSSGRIPTACAMTWKASASKPRTASACPWASRRTARTASAPP